MMDSFEFLVKQVFKLRDRGLNNQEIAKKLNKSVGWVKRRLRRESPP